MADTQIDTQALAAYLGDLHRSPVEGLTLEPLGLETGVRQQGHKGYGYGKPVRLTYRVGPDTHRRVLHTTAPGPLGHEHMAERAAGWLANAAG